MKNKNNSIAQHKNNKQNRPFIMKTNSLLILTITLLLMACGGKEEQSLTELKATEAELKTQLAEVSAKIAKLEGDSAGKFVLIEAKAIVPSIFKTYINIQGRVDADENVVLSTEMPGTISKINVKVGDLVSKGQVLAETDTRALQQSISDLQINLELVTQVYEKQKVLWEQKVGTELQYLQAKTSKESTAKKLELLQEQIRMSKIISPIDGNVDAVDVKLGQMIAPGSQAIRVINFSNLKVKADLAESFVSKVHKGNEVMIKFPDTNDSLISTVNFSARSISAMNRTFAVEVLLEGRKDFHPNQIAILSINDYKSEKPVMVLALKYVQKDLKGQTYVLLAEGNKVSKRFIKLSKEYKGFAEVAEGLTEKDLVITEGYEGLNEGDAVKIKA
jgi:membrane fusion protein, multidrug efflux system